MIFWIALMSFISGFAFSYEICLKNPSYSYIEQSQLKQPSLFLIEKFRFDGSETILNVDCKQRSITTKLSRLIPHGQIVELISSGNLDQLKTHFPKREYPNVHFTLGSILDLKYPHQYDIIFAFDSLKWDGHFLDHLKKMQSALKPAGTIAISIRTDLPKIIEQTLEEFIKSEKWGPFFKDFLQSSKPLLNEIQDLLLQFDFAINLIEKKEQKNTFETKEEFFNFIEIWIEEIKAIPEDKKTEFLDDLFNRYLIFEGIDFLNTQKVELCPTYLLVIAHKR